jgi:hypothetical protein
LPVRAAVIKTVSPEDPVPLASAPAFSSKVDHPRVPVHCSQRNRRHTEPIRRIHIAFGLDEEVGGFEVIVVYGPTAEL